MFYKVLNMPLITVHAYCQKQPSTNVLIKGILKICSKFIGEHLCQSVISLKLQSNFIEITLRHGCSPVNLLQIFGTPLEGCFYTAFHCQYSPGSKRDEIQSSTQFNSKCLTLSCIVL